jgi:hypothetical protein
MITDYFDLLRICVQTTLILLVLMLLYKNHIISIFDPLFFYLLTQAFSIELAFLTIDTLSYLTNFLCCQLFFNVGFLLLSGKPVKKRVIITNGLLQPDMQNLSTIKVFAISVSIIIILANIYLISKTGIALLAEDPSAAKSENFSTGGGLGLIRRMNWGILYLCSLFLIYLILYKKSALYVTLSFVLIFILVLSGSKGVLLYFITLIPLLSKFEDVKHLKIFKWIDLSKYVLLCGGVILALVIIIAGTKGSTEQAVFALASRFLFFGDAMLYYYDHYSVKYFSHFNFIEFLNLELNSILGFFRIVSYKRPLGFELVNFKFSMISDTVFGPNVPYYVKGHIFFGSVGAVIYSFFVGGVVGLIRRSFYKLLERPRSIIISLLVIHLNLVIYNYPQDSQLLINVLFDTFFQATPIYLLIYLVLKKSILKTADLVLSKAT